MKLFNWTVRIAAGTNRNVYVSDVAKIIGGKDRTQAEMIEAAQLISAAPEMLRALMEAELLIAGARHQLPRAEVLARIQAARRKAEGRLP